MTASSGWVAPSDFVANSDPTPPEDLDGPPRPCEVCSGTGRISPCDCATCPESRECPDCEAGVWTPLTTEEWQLHLLNLQHGGGDLRPLDLPAISVQRGGIRFPFVAEKAAIDPDKWQREATGGWITGPSDEQLAADYEQMRNAPDLPERLSDLPTIQEVLDRCRRGGRQDFGPGSGPIRVDELHWIDDSLPPKEDHEIRPRVGGMARCVAPPNETVKAILVSHAAQVAERAAVRVATLAAEQVGRDFANAEARAERYKRALQEISQLVDVAERQDEGQDIHILRKIKALSDRVTQ